LTKELAQRGAQVIAVVPDLSDPASLSLIDLVRHTTDNELVYAEACDLTSPTAIKDFCAQFMKSSGGGVDSEPPRLDAVVFAHEYVHIGAFRGSVTEKADEKHRRLEARLATFFFTTLLLPVLLTAPQERDIRFINIVNPFYGAAIPSFDPKSNEHPPTGSIWIEEGRRSLENILFTRHFQRILDALPSPSVRTRTSNTSSTGVKMEAEAIATKRPSNIVALAVSPGISRWDTLAPFMRADRGSTSFSMLGFLL
jgi:NAD(P)-dependent dehydrogenase (short-subunit alcohol dehydrogenase family)